MPGAAGFTTEPLSGAGEDVRQARVAMTPAGAVVAAWVHTDGDDVLVEVAVRPAGASAFGAPVALATPAGVSGAFELAVDAQGSATVAWADPGGAFAYYRVATLPAGASAWGVVDALAETDGIAGLEDIAVVAGATGRVTVVWDQGVGLRPRAETRPGSASAPSRRSSTTRSSRASSSCRRRTGGSPQRG